MITDLTVHLWSNANNWVWIPHHSPSVGIIEWIVWINFSWNATIRASNKRDFTVTWSLKKSEVSACVCLESFTIHQNTTKRGTLTWSSLVSGWKLVCLQVQNESRLEGNGNTRQKLCFKWQSDCHQATITLSCKASLAFPVTTSFRRLEALTSFHTLNLYDKKPSYIHLWCFMKEATGRFRLEVNSL